MIYRAEYHSSPLKRFKEILMNLEEAISLLKNAVKYSEVKNQKHIDLTLCSADERPKYQKALVIVNDEVKKGTLTDSELKSRLTLD
jgi:hypothetical protein